MIISLLEKGKKGTNIALKVKISKQISHIRKNKEKILKFTNSVKMSRGFKICDTYSLYINSSKS